MSGYILLSIFLFALLISLWLWRKPTALVIETAAIRLGFASPLDLYSYRNHAVPVDADAYRRVSFWQALRMVQNSRREYRRFNRTQSEYCPPVVVEPAELPGR